MISGILHTGSGLGNQLHRMVATRVLAWEKGYEWSMVSKDNFKGKSFIHVDIPEAVTNSHTAFFQEKKVVENGIDIRGYDPEINFVEDNTVIDGEFQDERYFYHKIDKLRTWLITDPLAMDKDMCVINFRGGEYTLFPDLFLTKEYWYTAIDIMKSKGIQKFVVATDDVLTARQFFPEYKCIYDIGLNWRMIRYARHLILSNSSFAILPALLNEDVDVIAPRYWARRNIGVWATPQNYYKKFLYI